MNITAIRVIQHEAEQRALNIQKMLVEYDAACKVIDDLDALLKYCGHMEFVGTSGKIGEMTPILSVSINAVAGCRKIPELIRDLAGRKVKELESEFEKLQPVIE